MVNLRHQHVVLLYMCVHLSGILVLFCSRAVADAVSNVTPRKLPENLFSDMLLLSGKRHVHVCELCTCIWVHKHKMAVNQTTLLVGHE